MNVLLQWPCRVFDYFIPQSSIASRPSFRNHISYGLGLYQ